MILGDNWRMPTDADFRELLDNCTSVWTTLNGVNGLLFTSNVNGKTLFLPATGFYRDTSLINRGSSGNYWASTYNSATNAESFNFNSSSVTPQNPSARRNGFSIRAVKEPTRDGGDV